MLDGCARARDVRRRPRRPISCGESCCRSAGGLPVAEHRDSYLLGFRGEWAHGQAGCSSERRRLHRAGACRVEHSSRFAGARSRYRVRHLAVTRSRVHRRRPAWRGSAEGGGRPVQVAVPSIRHARSLALGQLYGCAITGAGAVRCFGSGPFRPGRAIPGIARASALAVSSTHACAIIARGRVTCFGVNYGRSIAGAGSPTTIYRRARLAAGVTGARALAISASVNCAILKDWSVRCWGAYDGVEPIREARVPGLPPLKTLAGPSHVGSHFCGLTRQGATYCWGAREGGALGISSGVDVRLPRPGEAVRVPISTRSVQ